MGASPLAWSVVELDLGDLRAEKIRKGSLAEAFAVTIRETPSLLPRKIKAVDYSCICSCFATRKISWGKS